MSFRFAAPDSSSSDDDDHHHNHHDPVPHGRPSNGLPPVRVIGPAPQAGKPTRLPVTWLQRNLQHHFSPSPTSPGSSPCPSPRRPSQDSTLAHARQRRDPPPPPPPVPQPSLIPLPDVSPAPKRPAAWDAACASPTGSPRRRAASPNGHASSSPTRQPAANTFARADPTRDGSVTVASQVDATIELNEKLARMALEDLKTRRAEEQRRLREAQEAKEARERELLARQQAERQQREAAELEAKRKAAEDLRKQREAEAAEVERKRKEQEEQDRAKAEALAKMESARAQLIQQREAEAQAKAESEAKAQAEAQAAAAASAAAARKAQEEQDARRQAAAASAPTHTPPSAAPVAAPTAVSVPAAAPAAGPTSTPAPPAPTGPPEAPMPGLMIIISQMKNDINPRMKTPQNKRDAIELRKAINTAVGQLNNTREKLNQVFIKVDGFLNGVKTKSPDLHYPYALNLLAKSFCRQAEAEMRPDVTKAFPYGQVAVLLMCRHPEFRRYLLARMFKFCPYLIPRWYEPKNDAERKSLLRRRQGEDDEKYMERMSTHVALFAAMLQTTPIIPAFKNPLPMGFAWAWLAHVLNHPPKPLMVFLIEKFLLIAGHAFLETFGKQGQKMMHALVHDYAVKCGDSVRPVRSRWEGMWNPVQQRWVIDVSSERDPKVVT